MEKGTSPSFSSSGCSTGRLCAGFWLEVSPVDVESTVTPSLPKPHLWFAPAEMLFSQPISPAFSSPIILTCFFLNWVNIFIGKSNYSLCHGWKTKRRRRGCLIRRTVSYWGILSTGYSWWNPAPFPFLETYRRADWYCPKRKLAGFCVMKPFYIWKDQQKQIKVHSSAVHRNQNRREKYNRSLMLLDK